MAKLDIFNKIQSATTDIPIAAYTTTQTGGGVDLQGCLGALIIITPGEYTDGSCTFKLQDSDVSKSASMADVAAPQLQGTAPTLSAEGDDDAPTVLGYLGGKRYIRTVATMSGTSSGSIYGTQILKVFPRDLNPIH